MKTTFPQRLSDFIYHTRKSDSEFAKSIGIPRGNLYNYLHSTEEKKLGSPHVEILSRLFNAYPELNAYWILCGKGNMLNDEGSTVSEPSSTYHSCAECKNKQKTIDFLIGENESKSAKIIKIENDLEQCRYDLRELRQKSSELKGGQEKRKAG